MLLKVIGDLERISDHAVNLVDSAEEIRSKGLRFPRAAEAELANLRQAVEEILSLAQAAFVDGDMRSALTVEPLEQVLDRLKDRMRNEHILRLQQGTCTIETGFVWSDILTNLERVSDHCSNIAGCVIDAREKNLNLHESLQAMRADSPYFRSQYQAFTDKYLNRV